MSTSEILTIAPAGVWHLDPVHSAVTFEVAYLAGTFKGLPVREELNEPPIREQYIVEYYSR